MSALKLTLILLVSACAGIHASLLPLKSLQQVSRADCKTTVVVLSSDTFSAGVLAKPRGAYLSITPGVGQLNLTLTASGVAAPEASSGQVCTVGGLPNSFTYYPTDDAAAVSATEAEDPIAYIYVTAPPASLTVVTFYGGNLGSALAGSGTVITAVDNSTDTSAATGPLYVTKREVSPGQNALDLAQFAPQRGGSTAFVAGGLTTIGADTEACNYEIRFMSE